MGQFHRGLLLPSLPGPMRKTTMKTNLKTKPNCPRDAHGAKSNADLRLKIELIPQPLWRRNLRTIMGEAQWHKIKERLAKHPGCAICGSRQGPLQAHETWDYKEGKTSGIVTLKQINRVCQDCHSIIHIGRTRRLLQAGAIPQATWKHLIAHFLHVNNCDKATWLRHSREATATWERRSSLTWSINIHSYLNGTTPSDLPATADK